MTDFLPMPGCRVEQITPKDPDFLDIAAHGTGPSNRCPDCGRASRAVHSRYRRQPADLPSLGRRVGISLRVRRFYCRNVKCARRTFAERLPELVAAHSRRTCRLAAAQARVGAALGGNAGSRLLHHLAMPASADTVLRLVGRLPLPAQEPPRIVGVDDWAIRKRCAYGTVVVDLERRRVLDLLPDRTAETLAEWLRGRPGIKAIARERSTEYARGIALGAPKAEQIAVRWHLLANMRQAVERWLHVAQARLRRLPSLPSDAASTALARRDQAFRRSAPERAAGAESRNRWQARHAEVRRRHLAGETLLGIARQTGLALGTVGKYARAETFPARISHGPGPSILDPYLSHLERRLAEGCENGLTLWRELRGQGFPGGTRQVHRWLIERRIVPAKTGPHVRHIREAGGVRPSAARNTAPALPTTRQLAWLLVQPAAALGAADAATSARVRAGQGGCGRCRAGTPVHGPCARLRRGRSAGRPRPGRPGHRTGCLAGRRPCVQRPCHRDVCCRAGGGRRGNSGRPDPALEQRPGRRPDTPHQAAKTAKLRPHWLKVCGHSLRAGWRRGGSWWRSFGLFCRSGWRPCGSA